MPALGLVASIWSWSASRPGRQAGRGCSRDPCSLCVVTSPAPWLAALAADGTFKPATVKSVHYKRLPVGRVSSQGPGGAAGPRGQGAGLVAVGEPASASAADQVPATRVGVHGHALNAGLRVGWAVHNALHALLRVLAPRTRPGLTRFPQVVAGQTAALALKKVKRHQVRPAACCPQPAPHPALPAPAQLPPASAWICVVLRASKPARTLGCCHAARLPWPTHSHPRNPPRELPLP